MITNIQLSGMLYEIASYKELDGANFYQVKSYQDAARLIEKFNGPLDSTNFQQFHGIGSKISSKIEEAIRTGTIQELEKFRMMYPNLEDLKLVRGVGPKKAMKLYQMYQVKTRQELKLLFEQNKIIDNKLYEALQQSFEAPPSYMRIIVQERIGGLLSALEGVAERVCVVGSMRRQVEMVKDVDIVAQGHREQVFNVFHKFGIVINNGDRKSAIWMFGSLPIQIDVLLVHKEIWGSSLNYFTGSRSHNVRLRVMAKERGMLVNEYGIFDSNNNRIGGEKEEDLYNILNIPYVQPQNRID